MNLQFDETTFSNFSFIESPTKMTSIQPRASSTIKPTIKPTVSPMK